MKRNIILMLASTLLGISQINAQQPNDLLDFHPSWGQSINPPKIERAPTSATVADAQGNVYLLCSVMGKGVHIGQGLDPISVEPRRSTAVLIKYSKEGKAIWSRTLSGGIVKGYTLHIDQATQRIYACGTYDNTAPLVAQKTGNETVGNEIRTGGYSDDMFLASYTTDGNLLGLINLGGAKDSSGAVTTSIEVPTDLCISNGVLYISGSTHNGSKPNFTGTPIETNGGQCGFIVRVDATTLAIRSADAIVGLSEPEIFIASLATHQGRVFFCGNSNADKVQFTQGDRQASVTLKGSPNALLVGEVNVQAAGFKTIKTLPEQEGDAPNILGCDLVINAQGIPLIVGNVDKGIKLTDGKVHPAFGAYLMVWDLEQEMPSHLKAIGMNSEDNIAKAIALDATGHIYVGGNCAGKFDAVDPPTLDLGRGDAFVMMIDEQTMQIRKNNAFGSSGSDELGGLCINASASQLIIDGYYGGSGFNLNKVKDVKPGGTNYFIAAIPIPAPNTNSVDQVQEPQSCVAYPVDHGIEFCAAGHYRLFDLQGRLVSAGDASVGLRINLNAGIYILQMNQQVVKYQIR